jgi:hypothetical protein
MDEFGLDYIKAIENGHPGGKSLNLDVYKKWISEKKIHELITILNGEYDTALGDQYEERLHLISDALIKDGSSINFKKLWRHRIQQRKSHYFEYLSTVANIKDEHLQAQIAENVLTLKNWVLVALRDYDDNLTKIGGMQDERAKMRELRALIEEGKKPKAKPTADKRKMDEAVFWEVIDEARAAAEFPFEVPERLKEKLEAMSATAIKKFDKLFRKNVFALYHWDLWALAYISGGGCSDDAFEYFCAGLVLQGKDFYELARNNIPALAHKLSTCDETLECEAALYLAEQAYENKTGDILPTQDVPIPDIQGEKWEEADLPVRYPEFCRIFNWSA